MPFAPATIERFWSHVDKRGPDECWPWTSSTWHGYGRCTVQGQSLKPHRVAFYLANGHWPTPSTLHSCDNPACCNPNHLAEGTQQDNINDMRRRGRERKARGERASKAKLTAHDVQIIRVLAGVGLTRKEIAERYNVSNVAISYIVLRRNWKHVPDYDYGKDA